MRIASVGGRIFGLDTPHVTTPPVVSSSYVPSVFASSKLRCKGRSAYYEKVNTDESRRGMSHAWKLPLPLGLTIACEGVSIFAATISYTVRFTLCKITGDPCVSRVDCSCAVCDIQNR